MKITKATLHDIYVALSTRALSAEKGHDMTYEAGILSVRTESQPGRLFLFPAANIVAMEAEETPRKK